MSTAAPIVVAAALVAIVAVRRWRRSGGWRVRIAIEIDRSESRDGTPRPPRCPESDETGAGGMSVAEGDQGEHGGA